MPKVPIRLNKRIIAHILVEVQVLGIAEVGVGEGGGFGGPVGRQPAAHARRVIPRPKVVQPRLRVPFFGGEGIEEKLRAEGKGNSNKLTFANCGQK